jgi:RNA polymerase sigma-70 factor (ECF subfamily)
LQSDRELARRIHTARDEAAFRTLYRRHTPRLYQVLARILDVRADAEDAAQETWMRAVQGLSSFRWESAFESWLIGIGINVARTMIRRRHDYQELTPDTTPAMTTSLDGRIDMERALVRLPPGQRMVLVLHDVEGWTHEQIAQRLGMAAGTSKSQLFDARRALHALLHPVSSRPSPT